MNLAIDKQGIIKDYYKGNADLLAWPFPPYPGWKDLYTPLDQMPSKPTVDGSQASVQELFGYNPDKAKQLLAQAGYPNGFKTQVMSTAAQSDFLAIIKDQLSKVGIDLAINPVEVGVYNSTVRTRGFPEMIYRGSPTAAFPSMMVATRPESPDDTAYYSSPVTDAAYVQEAPYVGIDDAKWTSIVKAATPDTLERSPGIWLPGPWAYRAWWPWLKDYHGEGSIGYDNQSAFTWYSWIDQSLKKSMGY